MAGGTQQEEWKEKNLPMEFELWKKAESSGWKAMENGLERSKVSERWTLPASRSGSKLAKGKVQNFKFQISCHLNSHAFVNKTLFARSHPRRKNLSQYQALQPLNVTRGRRKRRVRKPAMLIRNV